MALEPLLRKVIGILRDPGCGRWVSAYTDDITIFATEIEHLQKVDENINVYEKANINREESVSLQLDIWREK